MACCASDSAEPFVWGETTEVAHAGWGRMVPLKDERWLCVTTRFSRPNSVLQFETSTDGAKTWTAGATVAEVGRNVDNGDLLPLPDGSLLLTGRSVVNGREPRSLRSYHLPVYRSTDSGATWTYVSQIDTSEPSASAPVNPSQGLWEPYLYLLPDGRVACAYANEKHSVATPAYSQVVSERISGDGGKTWGAEITLASQTGGGAQRPGMPVVTRLRDGGYFAVYEVVGIGNADVHEKVSEDGVTWPPGIGQKIPNQHAGPWVTALSDGRLVVTSCSNQISVSDDGGSTWRKTAPAFPALGQVFSWPAIYQTAPDIIAVMTTRNGIHIRWGHISLPAVELQATISASARTTSATAPAVTTPSSP